MNVSQINKIPDIKLQVTASKTTSKDDGKSFKNALDKSKSSVENKDKNLEKTEVEDVVKTKNIEKDKIVQGENEVFKESEVNESNSNVDGENIKTQFTEGEIIQDDFPGNNEENLNEDIISVLSSLMNLLNTFKEQISSGDGKSNIEINPEINPEIKNLVMEFISGKISAEDALDNENLSSSLKQVLNVDNLEELFEGKDTKLAQEVMKILNVSGSEDNTKTELVEKLDSLISQISNVISTEKKPNEVKKNEQLIFKLNSLVNNSSEENVKTTNSELEVDKVDTTNNLNHQVTNKNVQVNGNVGKTVAEGSVDNKTLKEDKFLEGIINEKEDSSYSKVVQLNSFNKTPVTNDIPKETPVVSRNTAVQDIIKTFKYMEDNNFKELTVKIKPKELGEITIKLITQGEIMKASINASNKETYDLLNSKVQEIKYALNTQNIKIEDVSIDFNDSFQSFQSGEGNFSREEKNSQRNVQYSSKDNLENTDTEENIEISSNLNILA